MWVRVLGSAAGGGFPQWNCDCPGCRAVRDGSRPCVPRTQSSIAVSADYRNWFLFNASPDVQHQIEAFPALRPRAERTTPVAAVLLTDGELDHTLGLLLLRESRGIPVYGTESVRQTLYDGSGVLRTLERYCPVDFRPVAPGDDVPLDGGLSIRAFDLPTTKRPRFEGVGGEYGRVVGYRVTDERTGSVMVYAPGMQQLTPEVRAQLADCTCLLIDGTCWDDREMIELGLAGKTSRDMGHLPISGPDGSMARLASLPIERKIYIHLNNSNPVLLDDSPERRSVEEHGMEVAVDGLEIEK